MGVYAGQDTQAWRQEIMSMLVGDNLFKCLFCLFLKLCILIYIYILIYIDVKLKNPSFLRCNDSNLVESSRCNHDFNCVFLKSRFLN